MTATRLTARIAVHAGRFASQPLAFAHLLDACDPAPDLDAVEVVPPGAGARLAQWFDAATVEALQAALSPGEVFVVVLPGAGAALPRTGRVRPLGVHRGHVLRRLEGE